MCRCVSCVSMSERFFLVEGEEKKSKGESHKNMLELIKIEQKKSSANCKQHGTA